MEQGFMSRKEAQGGVENLRKERRGEAETFGQRKRSVATRDVAARRVVQRALGYHRVMRGYEARKGAAGGEEENIEVGKAR